MLFYVLLFVTLIILYFLRKYFNGPRYHKKDELTWKTVIVTGSSAGIGKETAFDLLHQGANVIFACRDEAKTRKAINEIRNNEVRSRAKFMKLDLSSIDSVVSFVKEFKKTNQELDILVNNAGAFPDNFIITDDGIEQCIQANHLGHMALTCLLMDTFSKDEARIINVSSIGHRRSNYTIEELKRLEGNLEFKGEGANYSLSKALMVYGNSKLANVFFTQKLAEVLEKKYPHIKTASLHPGFVNTEFTRFISGYNVILRTVLYPLIMTILYFVAKDVNVGAQTTLALCYMPFEKIESGEYYADCKRVDVYAIAKSVELRDEFMKYSWMLLDKITKDKGISIPKIC